MLFIPAVFVVYTDFSAVSEIVERGFSPEGHPPVLPVETKRQRVNMISAVSSQGKVRFMIYQDTMKQQWLIQFMERLIRASKQKVFLILDNLKVHHGKLAASWLEKHKDKIEVFFLPPYAPEYNPDEYLNHALKLSIYSGQLPYTVEDISHKIQSFMRKLQHHPLLVSNFFLHTALSYP
ncbi:IS630 family transposase [Clostridiaceae bacterium]|nr:IS630 family transposase [Clostridiaceae bacterium]